MALFNFFGKKENETPSAPPAAEPEKKAMKITKKSTASNPLLSDASLSVVDKSILLREQEDLLIKQKIQVDNREIALSSREKEVEALLEELKSKIASQNEGQGLSSGVEGTEIGEGIDVEDATRQLLLWEEKLIEKEKELEDFHTYLQQLQGEVSQSKAQFETVPPAAGANDSEPRPSGYGLAGFEAEDPSSQLLQWEQQLKEKEDELQSFHAYLEKRHAEQEENEQRLQHALEISGVGSVPLSASATVEQTDSQSNDSASQLQIWEERLRAKENELLERENALSLREIEAEVTPEASSDSSAVGATDRSEPTAVDGQQEVLRNEARQLKIEIQDLSAALADKDLQLVEAQGVLQQYHAQLETQGQILADAQSKLEQMQNAAEANLDVVALEVQQMQHQLSSQSEELLSSKQLASEQLVQISEKERQLEEHAGELAALQSIMKALEERSQDALEKELAAGQGLRETISELEETLFLLRNELQETVSLKIASEEEYQKQLAAYQSNSQKAADLQASEDWVHTKEQQLQSQLEKITSKEAEVAVQQATLEEKHQAFAQMESAHAEEYNRRQVHLAETEQQLAALELELKEKETWVLQQQSIAAEAMLNTKDMEQLWAEKEAMIAKKEQAIVEYKEQLSALKQQVKTQQQEVDSQSKDLANYNEQIAKLQQELMAQQEASTRQLVENEALVASESALKLELDRLNAALENRQQEDATAWAQKESELEHKAAALGQLEQQLALAQSKLAADMEGMLAREATIQLEQDKAAQALQEARLLEEKLEKEAQELARQQAEAEQKLQELSALEALQTNNANALEESKAKLEADEASFAQKVADYESTNAAMIEQERLANERVTLLSTEAAELEQLKVAFVAEREAFGRTSDEAQKVLSEQEESLRVQLEAVDKQQQELSAISKAYDDKAADYQALISDFRVKELDLAAQIEAFSAEKAAFFEKNSHIEASITKFDEMEQQLNDRSNQIALVEQLLQDRDAQINQREKELLQITKEINAQAEQLQQREQELNQWQKKLENLEKPIAEIPVEKPTRPKTPEPEPVAAVSFSAEPFNVNINLENGDAFEAELEGSFTGNDIIETLIDNELIEGNTSYAIYWEEGRNWIDLTQMIGQIGLTENSSIKIEKR